ncbi:hypothetical protein [Acinetobacter stercoris]|nr:hypothetical protein [Acinetobacter stercoris]
MSLIMWIAQYMLQSLFYKWVLSWGGAAWLEGWKAMFLFDWITSCWTAELIRLYALILWVIATLVFIIGVFVPDLRF